MEDPNDNSLRDLSHDDNQCQEDENAQEDQRPCHLPHGVDVDIEEQQLQQELVHNETQHECCGSENSRTLLSQHGNMTRMQQQHDNGDHNTILQLDPWKDRLKVELFQQLHDTFWNEMKHQIVKDILEDYPNLIQGNRESSTLPPPESSSATENSIPDDGFYSGDTGCSNENTTEEPTTSAMNDDPVGMNGIHLNSCLSSTLADHQLRSLNNAKWERK